MKCTHPFTEDCHAHLPRGGTAAPVAAGLKRLARAVVVAAAAALAAACSVLRIDVDVYKGPLVNEHEVQVRQFAALAVAAKPLLAALRNDIEDIHRQAKGDPGLSDKLTRAGQGARLERFLRDDEPLQARLARFVNGALSSYEDFETSGSSQLSVALAGSGAANASGFDSARLSKGIETLTREFLQAAAQNRPASSAAPAPLLSAQEHLSDALIAFAERVLFVVNQLTQRSLAEQFSAQSYIETDAFARVSVRLGVLQTLGNSLVLHANDLRRRQNHLAGQRGMGQVEENAVQAAARPGADASFQQFASAASVRATRAGAELAAARAASAAAGVAVLDATRLRDEAAQAAKRLEGEVAAAELAQKHSAALLRSFFEPPASLGLPALEPVAAGQEINDREALAKALRAADALAGEPVHKLVDAQLESLQGKPEGAREPRKSRLADARAALAGEAVEALAAARPTPTPASAEIHAALRPIMVRLFVDAQQKAKKLQAQWLEQRKELDQRARDLLDAEARAARARQDATAAADDQNRNDGVAKVLGKVRAAVLAKAIETETGDLLAMQRLIEMHLKTVPAGEDATQWEAARRFISGFTPGATSAMAAPTASDSRADNPTRVFDELIAHLRQQRIAATAAGETERADRLTEAMKLAYESRSATLFLRPSSDYLKSVYSSVAVQDDVEPLESNMLDDYLRFVGRLLPTNKNAYREGKLEAREQIEKLYWQSINRVQLRGGGDTNYTLIKDDVGNWVVKAYAADASAIFRSAQSLALFATGKGINHNLLRRLELEREAADDAISPDRREAARGELGKMGPQSAVGLGRLRDRLIAAHVKELATAAGTAHETVNGLAEVLRAKVKAVTGVDASAVDTVIKEHTDALAESAAKLKKAAEGDTADPKRGATLGSALLEGVRALREHGLKLGKAVDSEKISADADIRRKAADAARRAVGERAEAMAKALRDSIDRLDAGLTLVGTAQ